MPSAIHDQLLIDLDTYIRSNGSGGKTTAADLRAFLTRLLTALDGVLGSSGATASRTFRIVATQAQRDALPGGTTVEADGLSAGERTADMFVYVVAEEALYHLHIPGFAALSDAAKLVALNSNSHWTEFSGTEGFTAITQNQYGTHPAFTTQQALNVYLLAHTQGAVGPIPTAPTITSEVDTNEGSIIYFDPNATHPVATEYEYRVTATGYPTSPWRPCTSFILVLDNEVYAPHSIEIRVAAADGFPAGSKALNESSFEQYFYPIMLNIPTYDAVAQTLTVTARNDGDANTAVIIDGTLLGYVGGPSSQYNTKSFPVVLSVGSHTIQGADGRNIYITPLRTFMV